MKIELAQRASHLLPKHRRIVKLGEVHGEAATFPSLQQTILINAHSYPRLNLRNTRVVSQDTGLSEIARPPQKSSTGGSKTLLFLLNALNDHSPDHLQRHFSGKSTGVDVPLIQKASSLAPRSQTTRVRTEWRRLGKANSDQREETASIKGICGGIAEKRTEGKKRGGARS